MTTTRERAAGSITVLVRATEPVVADLPARTSARPPIDIVDQWGLQSFPASDPPANW